jgi:hypothetical protein
MKKFLIENPEFMSFLNSEEIQRYFPHSIKDGTTDANYREWARKQIEHIRQDIREKNDDIIVPEPVLNISSRKGPISDSKLSIFCQY